MESAMNKKEKTKRLAEIQNAAEVKAMHEGLTRARSITVGTAFGGTTEISMRGQGMDHLYCIMQPVEVIELIHQLASNVGCHINLQPRKDFSSWRDWKYTEEELLHYRGDQGVPGVGHAPAVNDMAPHMQVGANVPPPDQQPGLNALPEIRNQEHVVAIKKTVNRRDTKRTAKAS